MTARPPISQKDIKLLYGNAASRCAFPLCRTYLSLEATNSEDMEQVGEIAHIIAHSPDGPRGDKDYPKEKLNKYENLILLCPTCHKTIDSQPSKYSIEFLRDTKANHETWVKESLSSAMDAVSFAELEIAAKALMGGTYTSSTDFTIIQPDEKIQKNNLTEVSRNQIIMGLSRGQEVEKFLSEMAKIDPSFPERLTDNFKLKYQALSNELVGDELFSELLSFAQRGSHDFAQQAAGLAILVHLFHICEIFEK